MKKYALSLIVVSALAAAAYCAFTGTAAGLADMATSGVAAIVSAKVPAHASVASAYAASGTPIDISGVIEYKKINLSFKNPGKIVELNFDEGYRVKKGAVLASIDTSDLLVMKKKAESALAYSMSLVPQLTAVASFQTANFKSQVLLATANLAAAKARLDEAVAGNREQQIEQARNALNKAKIEYDKLQKDYQRYGELLKSGSTTIQAYDTIKSQFQSAEQLMMSARNQYELLKEGSRKETIEVMKAGVEQAKAQVAGAEALEFQAKKAGFDLESLKNDIEIKKADIDSINIKLADATLAAPEDGIVLEKLAETSEVVSTATPIGVLANMVDVWVRGYIPEEDQGRVKIGQKAVIISDSFPDRPFNGYVSFISPEAEFTPKNVQTKRERVKLVYRVKINVDNSSQILKLGMPVDAKIMAD